MNVDERQSGLDERGWFKSSYSSNEGGACIEIAISSGTIHVRDSKNTQGPQLTFYSTEWSVFVSYAAELS